MDVDLTSDFRSERVRMRAVRSIHTIRRQGLLMCVSTDLNNFRYANGMKCRTPPPASAGGAAGSYTTLRPDASVQVRLVCRDTTDDTQTYIIGKIIWSRFFSACNNTITCIAEPRAATHRTSRSC